MAYIKENITFEEVEQSGVEMIYYAIHTCWWTHNPDHLCSRKIPGDIKLTRGDGSKTVIDPQPIPTDPRGSVLMQTDNVQDFLKSAKSNSGHYGKHGLKAFMAAHHQNCFVSKEDLSPWSLQGWQAYNDAIDSSQE